MKHDHFEEMADMLRPERHHDICPECGERARLYMCHFCMRSCCDDCMSVSGDPICCRCAGEPTAAEEEGVCYAAV